MPGRVCNNFLMSPNCLFVLQRILLVALVLVGSPFLLSGCGGGGGTAVIPTPVVPSPSIAATAQIGGAQLISIANTVAGATVYYTLDGSTPNANSLQYLAPFLITQSTTVNAITVSAATQSSVSTQSYTMNIPSGTLVWSEDFTNTTNANIQPDPAIWTYDAGATGYGNQELEDYCAWGSNIPPCTTANPNVYVGTDSALHIVALQPGASGTYTSARIRSQGLLSLPYGRIEARMMLPEGQGLWPAFWLLGNNYATVGWPACGELDVMEHVNAPVPDLILGSVHGSHYDGSQPYTVPGYSAAGWHIYGMIWSKGSVQYYVDSPSNIYATFTPAMAASQGGSWPFDSGYPSFMILNLAVGGTFPGSPDGSTPFPSQMIVDYVRLYTN